MRIVAFLFLWLSACRQDYFAADDFTYSDGDWTLEQSTPEPTFRLAEDSTYDGPAICGSDHGFTGGTERWRFAAPKRYSGNASRFYGRRLTWDSQTSSRLQYPSNSLYMSGLGISLVVQVPNTAMSTTWTTYSVWLDTRSPWEHPDGTKATEDEIRSTLATLRSLRLPGEWINGAEITCIDNVYFGIP